MNVQEFERRLQALARRDGMTFSTFATLGDRDHAVLLTTIVERFDAGAIYREREVNALLKGWLAGAGAMVGTDHVHVRRWLVDTQVLVRRSDCSEYRLHPEAAARPDIVSDEGVRALDPDAIVRAFRQTVQEERVKRKADWLARAAAEGRAGPG